VALTGKRVPIAPESDLRLLDLPDSTYDAYYNTFCNPLLWFTQHSIGDRLNAARQLRTEALESWDDGYVPVNRRFAAAVVEEIDAQSGDARVMINDYHLYLAPRFIREARPGAALQHFVHIPWPAPEAWSVLPESMVQAMCDGLLASDSVGFQTDACVDHFMATCRAYLGSTAEIDERSGEITYRGQTTSVWCNPISVDGEELSDIAGSPEVAQYKTEIETDDSVKTIVRVDRLDPSKNVLAGFQAYERLLENEPEMHGKVRFLAFLVPSRAGIPEYDDYAAEVMSTVDRINQRFRGNGWRPITVFHEQNRQKAFAGLALYDVLLVNSVADGMNLVSKEGPSVNERNGVLALSTSAGAYRELERGCVALDPTDIGRTATALSEALHMDMDERRARADILRVAIDRYQLSDWLRHQLKDLSIVGYIKGSRTTTAGSGRYS
jgi:trehalose 6-phosphate synthase